MEEKQRSIKCGSLRKRWNDMRPKRYPYSKPQWEKEYIGVYRDSSDEPIDRFAIYVNRLTGEVK